MLLAVYYVRLSPFCFSRLKLTRATIALSGCRDACIGSVASQHVPHRIRDAIADLVRFYSHAWRATKRPEGSFSLLPIVLKNFVPSGGALCKTRPEIPFPPPSLQDSVGDGGNY